MEDGGLGSDYISDSGLSLVSKIYHSSDKDNTMTSHHSFKFFPHRWLLVRGSKYWLQRHSNAELWCFLWCWHKQAVKRTMGLISDTTRLMWHYCKQGIFANTRHNWSPLSYNFLSLPCYTQHCFILNRVTPKYTHTHVCRYYQPFQWYNWYHQDQIVEYANELLIHWIVITTLHFTARLDVYSKG